MNERPPILPRDLGDGLVVRSTTAADAQAVGELAAHIFRSSPDAPPNPRQVPRTLELASGQHPLSGAGHGIVAEDTRRGEIVASLWALPIRWSFDGIPFGVGRPEQVVCQPRYRGRGIVRAMFDAFHAQSTAAGELVQAITGLSYYYRRYGYEYAITRHHDHVLAFDAIPSAPPSAYRLREATPDDVTAISALYDADNHRLPIHAVVGPAYWRWTLFEADPDTMETHRALMLVDAAGAACGYVIFRARSYGAEVQITSLAVDSAHEADAMGVIVAGLREHAAQLVTRDGSMVKTNKLIIDVDTDHPLLAQVARWTSIEHPYAWYVRVGDMPAFLRHVRPALEHRLARSSSADYDGDVLIDAYDYGVRLSFAHGRITAIAPWRAPRRPLGGVSPHLEIPPFAFVQLVFGYRDLDALHDIYPDVHIHDQGAAQVVQTLCGARPSFVFEMN